MNAWHLTPDVVRAYAEGRLTAVAALSVDQHVGQCAGCRQAVGATVAPARTDRLWAEIRERVEAPGPTRIERAVRALGLDEGTARLLAATPTLRGAWLTGVVLVLLLAVLAATASPRASAAFLALAPVLPVAGVAYAFGPLGDPGREIAAAAPYAALRLLVVRTAVVVSSTLVPGLLLAPFLPPTSWYAVGWLLPALAMTAVALALAERVAVHLSSVALTLGWLAAVSWSAVGPRDPAVLTAAPVQLLSVAAIAACAAVLVRHHRTPAPLWSPR